MMVDKFMVFDVESIGLHGEGFAVAWVVVNRDGERLDEGCIACDPADCIGTAESRLWVDEHVPALTVTSPTKQHLRNHFWHEWRSWADQGAVLVADCSWPVEANFLSACVKLNHAEREWQGPYPLHDLASVLLALGADALAVTERLPDELPAHHPLMDARQSARQLVACLKRRITIELSGHRPQEVSMSDELAGGAPLQRGVRAREELLAAFDAYTRPLVSKPHQMRPENWPKSWLFFEAGWDAAWDIQQARIDRLCWNTAPTR